MTEAERFIEELIAKIGHPPDGVKIVLVVNNDAVEGTTLAFTCCRVCALTMLTDVGEQLALEVAGQEGAWTPPLHH